MLEYVVNEIELKKAALCEWRQSRPAYIAVAPVEFGEHHFWHSTSSNSLTAGDLRIISGYWAGTMAFNPDGAVTTAIGERLQLKKPAPLHLA